MFLDTENGKIVSAIWVAAFIAPEAENLNIIRIVMERELL